MATTLRGSRAEAVNHGWVCGPIRASSVAALKNAKGSWSVVTCIVLPSGIEKPVSDARSVRIRNSGLAKSPTSDAPTSL